jgi:hypothetical protein
MNKRLGKTRDDAREPQGSTHEIPALDELDEEAASAPPLRKQPQRLSLLRSTGLPGVSDAEIARRQWQRNLEARNDLITEFGLLAGSQLEAWEQDGRIFSVNHEGNHAFPAFQFDREGQPLPVIAQVLETLGQQSKGWELALWFLAGNGWLDDRCPVDLLENEPEEVAQAAKQEAEELFS